MYLIFNIIKFNSFTIFNFTTLPQKLFSILHATHPHCYFTHTHTYKSTVKDKTYYINCIFIQKQNFQINSIISIPSFCTKNLSKINQQHNIHLKQIIQTWKSVFLIIKGLNKLPQHTRYNQIIWCRSVKERLSNLIIKIQKATNQQTININSYILFWLFNIIPDHTLNKFYRNIIKLYSKGYSPKYTKCN